MGSLSNYGELLALDVASGNKANLTGVTQTRYVALYTVDTPNEDGTLGSAVEVAGNGYERTAVTFGASAIASGGDNDGKAVATNSSPVTFPLASGNWGTIVSMAIWDDQTAGNMVWVGTLTASKIVEENDQLIFSTDKITLTMD